MHTFADLRLIIAVGWSNREADHHFHPMPNIAHKPHRATVCCDDRLANRKTKTRTNKRTLSRKRNHSRRQKGGMSPFGDTGRTLTDAQYAADGTNPQFRTEVDVNERYTGF